MTRSGAQARISPATIIASVALFFSLSGVGVAATGYRITSLWQVSPKVRAALRGHAGPQGPAGPQGAAGAAGEQGPAGPQAASADPRTVFPSIIWNLTQPVTSPPADLTAADPEATVTATCRAGDQALTGGFKGAGEIVSTTTLAGSNAWTVTAQLDPSDSEGSVEAWVYCTPGTKFPGTPIPTAN